VTTAGPDLLVLDVNNVLWRWRPTAEAGKGTLNRVTVEGSAEWGNDVTTMGTFLTDADADTSLYNLYVVDPSEQQIRAFAPDSAGEGFPEAAAWLSEPRPVEGVTSIHIDGDIYLADGGAVERFSAGQPDGWEPEAPGDDMLREPPSYDLITAASGRRAGLIYAWDSANARVVAWDKAEATFVEQFQLPEGNEGWADIRAMTVIESADEPPLLVWVSSDIVHASRLVDVDPPTDPGASADPSASPDPGASPGTSTAP
jgi:hypothetical protein